ncbi:hypothetical protein AB0D14_09185 [Streptomyces sp. NPDC048484]|uniref:hypothetical protein n=1 Tax=Streptomyces sp. NPDC048484 TaxID=3155146 RepID=UPI00341D82D8
MPNGMARPSFAVISGAQVHDALRGQEKKIVELVEETYRLHGAGQTVNPPSYFLRFQDRPTSRIIALPGSLGGRMRLDGMKWISSFPGNVAEGLIRSCDLVVFATVAGAPHITGPAWFAHNPLVLHVSLRDLSPEIILSATNVVDDVEHCLKADASPHLAEHRARPARCSCWPGPTSPPSARVRRRCCSTCRWRRRRTWWNCWSATTCCSPSTETTAASACTGWSGPSAWNRRRGASRATNSTRRSTGPADRSRG